MLHLLPIVVLIFCSFLVESHRTFHVVKPVKVDGDSTVYLLLNDKIRRIPNKETLEYLGYRSEGVEEISKSAFAAFTVGPDVENLVRRDDTPDEVMRVNSLRLKTFQDNDHLVKNWTKVGDFFNPTVIPFMGRYLVACGAPEGIKFAWLDKQYKMYTDAAYLGIGPGLTLIDPRAGSFYGADARIILISATRFMLVCTGWYGPRRVRYVEMEVDESQQLLMMVKNYRMEPPYDKGQDHKNWSPFVHNNSFLFIESTLPFRVLSSQVTQESINGSVGTMETALVSSTSVPWGWSYGTIRGGSPAKLIGRGRYLTFLHSRVTLPMNGRLTYFSGALVFSAEPPFQILAISHSPLYHPQFYDGPWDSIKYYDYVVYPMNFFFDSGVDEIKDECGHHCLKNNSITVSFGYQDGQGYVCKMNLLELVETMVQVGSHPSHELFKATGGAKVPR